MNQHPDDFERRQHDGSENGEQKYTTQSCGADKGPEPCWHGVSYQNNNGGYAPPMTFYEVEHGKKRKGHKVALIAVCVLLCAVLAVLAIGLSIYFTKEPAFNDPAGDTSGTNVNGSGNSPSNGTVYDAVDDSNYNYAGVVLPKNDGTGLAGHPNGSAGDGAGTTISAAAKVKDAVVEILTTQSNRYQTITAGVGSGVIIHADGIIVTNHHVVDGLETIYVRLTNGNTYKATVRGTDEEGDIAVIKIDPQETLTVATLGYSGALALGERVIAIGNPLGELGGTLTDGVISSTQRAVQVDGITMTLIQTNAAINSGNSGGGLFNMAGELIGIVNAKISAEGVEGLGFAIPIDTAIVSINHLLSLGYIPGTPALGVSVAADSVSLGGRPVYMTYVTQASGNLQEGDYIYSVDGTIVYVSRYTGTAEDAIDLLENVIRAHEVGDVLTLKIYRNGEPMEVSVTLVEYVPGDSSVNFQ